MLATALVGYVAKRVCKVWRRTVGCLDVTLVRLSCGVTYEDHLIDVVRGQRDLVSFERFMCAEKCRASGKHVAKCVWATEHLPQIRQRILSAESSFGRTLVLMPGPECNFDYSEADEKMPRLRLRAVLLLL